MLTSYTTHVRTYVRIVKSASFMFYVGIDRWIEVRTRPNTAAATAVETKLYILYLSQCSTYVRSSNMDEREKKRLTGWAARSC